MSAANTPPTSPERCAFAYNDGTSCRFVREDHVQDGGRSIVVGHPFQPAPASPEHSMFCTDENPCKDRTPPAPTGETVTLREVYDWLENYHGTDVADAFEKAIRRKP